MHEISVIIPHAGDTGPLHRCLTALASCVGFDRTDVIVADNDAKPIDADFCAAHPTVRFLHVPTPGAAHARNKAAEQAQSDVFFFIDSDCIPKHDTLTNALDEAPKHDIIGGAVLASTPGKGPLSPAEAFETIFAFDQARYITKKGFTVTACLVTHRRVFELVGGFTPGLSEDLNWCRRATAMGYSIHYAPKIRVSHPCRTTWPDLRAKWQRVTAETFALNDASRVAWIGKACLMPLSILVHAPRVLRSPKLPKLRDKAAALRMLARVRLWRMNQMLRLGFQSRA